MESLPEDLLLSLGASRMPSSNDSNTLATLIQRINFERGGFQTLTEESLRQEIAEKEAASGNDDEDDSSSDEEAEEDDRAKELLTARNEILGQIDSAHQSAMFALDFISLLLSKDMPNQGGATLSPFVRESVGTGTLGMDKIHATRTTDVQKQDNKQVSKGWKAKNLNKTVDSILASATRLEKEIELETKYWEQVLAVTENGWAVCRLPNERHTLGVRFGFSEASPAFRNRSLGALRRNPDGTIFLDQGLASSTPQAIRVRIVAEGVETGSTISPTLLPENAEIALLIQQARNTIFAQELWQELNRESRSLLSFLVTISPTDETISFPVSPTKTAIIDLAPLTLFSSPFPGPKTDQPLAEAVHLALHLFLSWSHRISHRRRTLPPPPISASTLTPKSDPLPLLRPLLNRLTHEQAISSLAQTLGPLARALNSAGLGTAACSIQPSNLNASPALPKAEQIFNHLAASLESIATFSLSPKTIITITGITKMGVLIPYFSIKISEECDLNETCPPPQFLGLKEVKEWLFWAIGCGLAEQFAADGGWEVSAQPNMLKKGNKVLMFSVKSVQRGEKGKERDGVRLGVKWDNGAKVKGKKGEGKYEWVSLVGDDKKRGNWNAGEGEVVRSLNDVVNAAGK